MVGLDPRYPDFAKAAFGIWGKRISSVTSMRLGERQASSCWEARSWWLSECLLETRMVSQRERERGREIAFDPPQSQDSTEVGLGGHVTRSEYLELLRQTHLGS